MQKNGRHQRAAGAGSGGGASQAWLARTVSGLFTTTTTEGLRWKTTTPWIGCGPGHEVVLISIVDTLKGCLSKIHMTIIIPLTRHALAIAT